MFSPMEINYIASLYDDCRSQKCIWEPYGLTSKLKLLTMYSIRFAHPSSERFYVLAHFDSVMVFQADFHCKSVKLKGQIRVWTLLNWTNNDRKWKYRVSTINFKYRPAEFGGKIVFSQFEAKPWRAWMYRSCITKPFMKRPPRPHCEICRQPLTWRVELTTVLI